ncbi:MAG: sporulation protein YunB [Oscillospiraceae bacterium]|jgi:sporulation protein YunB
MKRRSSRHSSVRGRIWFFILLLASLLILTGLQLRPVIEGVAAYQAKVFATKTVNDAVLAELAREGVHYGDMVQLSYSSNGNITSIQSNMMEINRLKAQVTKAVLETLENMGPASIWVPLGTLLGNEITSGRGPLVEIKIYPTGYVQTDIYSQFTSAGINQTNHQIFLGTSVQMMAVIPGYRIKCESSTSFVIAQTIIVGNIPDTYVQLGESSPFISKLKDEIKLEG